MCGRTCVGVTGGKKARAHALRTHVLEVILHPHALVRARTHLRNSSLVEILHRSKQTYDCLPFTAAINELLCVKNEGAQIAMDFR